MPCAVSSSANSAGERERAREEGRGKEGGMEERIRRKEGGRGGEREVHVHVHEQPHT